MPNSATQNPANKVGRNSGAGEGGISETVPTQAEAQRGVQPISTGYRPEVGRSGGTAARLGVATLLGAGIAAFVTRRLRKPKSWTDRVRSAIGVKKSRTDRIRSKVGWK
jgi:hypothetical protein